MSDARELCHRFEDWLLGAARQEKLAPAWQEHLDGCATCRAQWATHSLLEATFETEPLPELSSGFDVRLAAKVAKQGDRGALVRRLRGWRLAAMAAYAGLALKVLAWTLRDAPLPAIDPSSTWAALVACALVPPSLALALLLSRFIPVRTTGVANGGSGLMLSL